jgi:ribonuclease BN (tRNA processing enzyme)
MRVIISSNGVKVHPMHQWKRPFITSADFSQSPMQSLKTDPNQPVVALSKGSSYYRKRANWVQVQEYCEARNGPMKVVFLGVGEACDERLPNTCLWIQTQVDQQRRSILLDCGFTAPSLYWQQISDQEDLDALWISHLHGDHFFGVPALLLRLWEMKRNKPLVILGHSGVEGVLRQIMELAYPGFISKLQYPLVFQEVEPGQSMRAVGLHWSTAQSLHGQKNLAVRIEDGQSSVFYSGDGLFGLETVSLARGCSLAVHEAFRLDAITPGHGTVRQCIDFARDTDVGMLALVHVQRDERRDRYAEILRLLEENYDLHLILPEPGDELEL